MTDLINLSRQILSNFRKGLFQKIQKNYHLKVLISFLVYIAVILILPLTNSAIAQNSNFFELKEGVLVAPENNIIYSMSPQGGIDAINLQNGSVLWRTEEADKPLTIINNQLFCQLDNKTKTNELEIAILDVNDQGKRLSSKKIALPKSIFATIDEKLESHFKTFATVKDGSFYLSWDHKTFSRQGYEIEKQQRFVRDSINVNTIRPKAEKGLIRLNSGSDEIENLTTADLPVQLKRKDVELLTNRRKAGIPGRQFNSIDNKHIVGIERIGTDSKWNKYRWTLYDISGSKIGSIETQFSFMPFYVSNSQVVFITSPYIIRKDKELIEEPVKLRSFSLDTGEELWSVAVRDTQYRGPFPP